MKTLKTLLAIGIFIGVIVAIWWAGVALVSPSASDRGVMAAEVQLSSFEKMVDIYQLDTNKYPHSLEDLVRPPTDVSGWRGPYANRGIPFDPWGRPYRIERGEQGVKLACDGPDGMAGTSDDIEVLTEDYMPALSKDNVADTDSAETSDDAVAITENEVGRTDGMEASAKHKKMWQADFDRLSNDEKKAVAKAEVSKLCARAEVFRLERGHVSTTIVDFDHHPDPWLSYYRIEPIDTISVRVASNGPDRAQGTDDDIVKLTDAGDTRKQVTEGLINRLCASAEFYRLLNGETIERLDEVFRPPADDAPSQWQGHYFVYVFDAPPALKVPLDSWGKAFRLEQLDDETVRITSDGPDSETGTTDDINVSTNELQARRSAVVQLITHLGNIANGEYYLQTKQNIESLEDLVRPPDGLADPSKWRGPYLNQIPLDPWGNELCIRLVSNERNQRAIAKFASNGPDGIRGTEDDIGAR